MNAPARACLRHLRAAPAVALVVWGALVSMPPCVAQPTRDALLQRAGPPGARLLSARAQRVRQAALRAQAMRRVRALRMLQLYVRKGLRQPYTGEQVTRLLEGEVRESRQRVHHAGPGRERIEYLSPPGMQGEVLLLVGGRLFRAVPGQRRVLEGAAPADLLHANLARVQQDARDGRILLDIVGRQMVAGRMAAILEVRPAMPEAAYKRVWIDEQTGVRLRTEDVAPGGTVTATTYFVTIDLNPTIDPADLRPASLVGGVPRAPGAMTFRTVAQARAHAGFVPREPALPVSYRVASVWVTGRAPGKRIVAVRYTDGVNAFTLFQRPWAGVRGAAAPFGPGKVSQWVSGDRAYAIAGPLRPEFVRSVRDSLR